MRRPFLFPVILGACVLLLGDIPEHHAAAAEAAPPPRQSITISVKVDEVVRTALVYPAPQGAAAPLVFVFHGFGGSAGAMAGDTRMHEAMPGATVVYPQGLIVTSALMKNKGAGWENTETQTDQNPDLRFLDALLPVLQQHYAIDLQRVYATGMSTGGIFTYLLLTARPNVFAAFAPVAAANPVVWQANVPRPVLIIQGKTDDRISAEWAQRMYDLVRRLNQCGEETFEWAPGYLISYGPSATGVPVIWRLHDGGHMWPTDASVMIARFFQEHMLTE
jgi:polyhydroxybutyrate depolymerase